MKSLKQRIAELEDDVKQRNGRIRELTKERDEERELVEQMREHVEDADAVIEQWKEGFDMVLDDNGEWTIPDTVESSLYEINAAYRELLNKWNRLVPDYNAVVAPRLRNVGRPIAASETQQAAVLKLRKAGRSLRGIVDETSLGFATVRTIVEKGDGVDRATMRRLHRIAPDKFLEAALRRRKRSRDALPQRIGQTLKRGAELLKEAKDRR
jgi:hypothetical protein